MERRLSAIFRERVSGYAETLLPSYTKADRLRLSAFSGKCLLLMQGKISTVEGMSRKAVIGIDNLVGLYAGIAGGTGWQLL